jgi:hypothetical protein
MFGIDLRLFFQYELDLPSDFDDKKIKKENFVDFPFV